MVEKQWSVERSSIILHEKTQELLQRYSERERNFDRADLSYADLSETYLIYASLLWTQLLLVSFVPLWLIFSHVLTYLRSAIT